MIKVERISILIVEDDDVIRGLVREYLESFGFKNFTEAKDGSEAFRFVIDPLTRIDLIISDWNMPRTDGITLLKAVRQTKHRLTTPFIFITAQEPHEKSKILMAKQNEVNAYLVKPFRGDVLFEKVMHVLNESQAEDSDSGAA